MYGRMASPIRRLVVDILKPHRPDIVEFATEVAGCEGVDAVNAELVETDREVQNVKFTIVGEDVDVSLVETAITDHGGTVHSIDQVVCGTRLVEQTPTHQDR